MSKFLDATVLRRRLDYDPATGLLMWRDSPSSPRRWNTRYAGKQAGGRDSHGYIKVKIGGSHYLAHRLAWLHYYGSWPEFEIDHINGIRDDNRIFNLRDATSVVNNQNIKASPLGRDLPLGVSKPDSSGKYRAQIYANGTRHYLGYFSCPNTAHQAYLTAKRHLHAGCTI